MHTGWIKIEDVWTKQLKTKSTELLAAKKRRHEEVIIRPSFITL